MTTTPSGKPAAAGEHARPVRPQPGTARTVAAPQPPRLAVVTLPAEIDITNDGQLQDTLTRALHGGTAVLVADASATAFCGCAGVTALLLAHRRAAAAGAQLRVAASPAIQRVLQLTGADQVLSTYPTLTAALADGQPPDRP